MLKRVSRSWWIRIGSVEEATRVPGGESYREVYVAHPLNYGSQVAVCLQLLSRGQYAEAARAAYGE